MPFFIVFSLSRRLYSIKSHSVRRSITLSAIRNHRSEHRSNHRGSFKSDVKSGYYGFFYWETRCLWRAV